MSGGERVWRAALTLVGTPFRFHGHAPATGLDCVGLVVAAHRAAGVVPVAVPQDYRVRDIDVVAVGVMLAAAGLVRADDAAVGDVVLCAVGHCQVHLVIAGHGAFVHAHAGLRRVVLMPGVADGCVGRWRVGREPSPLRLGSKLPSLAPLPQAGEGR